MKAFPIGEDQFLEVPEERVSLRDRIFQLEEEMKKGPQVEIEVTHHYTDGIYAREIFIPKGTLLTGKVHKTEHLNIMSKGEISVLTEDGMKRVSAPFTMVSRAGTKRVGYAHEDTVWTTIHGTKETDLEKLEQELIASTEEDFELLREQELLALKEAT